MKTSKRVISLILTAVMIMTTFVVAAPMLFANAADITIDGVSQTRIVGTDGSYARTYAGYASDYMNGASEPTDIVVPGLDPAQDYVIQGMTYYPQKDWMLVTAYHNDETASSKVFCLDNTTGEFVAMISFLNTDSTTNMDHGGGIAISENNIYYSCGDKDRSIAYAPLSAIEDIAVGEHRVVQLVAEHTFYEVGSVTDGDATAYTAYVCYDQGVLWMGNFYDPGAIGGAIAADYAVKANNDWDNMVWGYELSGSTSEEEWANLTAGTTDCQGNPSYAIALADGTDGLDIKNVQYATVDNGKLYLSRSYGSGTGNSVTFGFDETSHLSIADIDLTTPGNTTITFVTDSAGTTRTITNAYTINTYQDFPMMPMSEGLCVIEDYIYITFESASNKYLNESDGLTGIGNCVMPVDVVWKVDQYELMGAERPDEETLLYYEQITALSQIEDGEDYLIVYESPEKDPVTQRNYLYALDSHGGLKGNYLSKHDSADTAGYAAMIGYELHDYSLEDGKLYLYDAVEDDLPNIRWTISGANSGNLRIKNDSTYFSEYCYLYFDGTNISMADSTVTDLSNMSFAETGTGSFYLQNAGSYLWCNDFSVAGYEAAANSGYATYASSDATKYAMYTGVSEQKGTFHPNGLGTSNIIGQSVDPNYYLGQFQIYKRVVDPYLSTKESRVYTDMNAELQEDGTYTITLDTYATGEVQYQVLDEERPTDFVFVLDTSASMTNNSDCSGYQRYDGDLSAYSIAGDSTTIGDSSASTMSGGFMFIKYNGEYCVLTVEGSARGNDGSWISPKYYKRYWISMVYQGTTYWWVPNSTTDASQGGSWSTTKPAESATMYVQANSDSNRAKAEIYRGEHYRYFSGTGATRLCCMQTAMDNIVDGIKSDAAAKGFDHRIAIVQYGSDGADDVAWLNTGMYTNSSTTIQQYSGEGTIAASTYAGAFYDTGAFDTVKDIVWAMNTSGGDSDTFSNYGFDMANGIINNSGKDYLATGDRSLAIITITDGVPGKGGEDSASANTTAESAVSEVYEAKTHGASVYSLQMGNNSMDGFSMNLYMDAISSEYPTAKSLTDLGEKNPTDVEYHIDVPTGTTNMFDVISSSLLTSVQKNSTMGYAVLTADSIVREQLSQAFVVPMNADGSVADGVSISYAKTPGWYDAIGRLTWGTATAATGIVGEYDGDRTVKISGYDYTSECISLSRTKTNPGNKLTVTITGLLANEAADLTNTSINNDTNTAVYQDSTWLANNYAFKHYPREYFTIPEYVYVLDYGLEMYDDDVNGTLKSVSADLSRQRDADGNLDYKTISENGLVEITNNNQDLIYTTTPTNFADSGYCLIQRDSGKFDWFEIKVVPASAVLFEENYVVDGTAGAVTWATDGSPTNTQQSVTNEETDVYGYDAIYATTEHTHSNGSAYKATVSSSAKRSATKTFDFIGSGLDLVSACGKNTGIMIVKISGGNLTNPKAYIVDTYYSGNHVNAKGLLCQTPIVNFTGDHGTYTVEVTATYLSTAKALKSSVTGSLANGKLAGTTGVPVTEADAKELLSNIGMEDLANADLELVWFDDNSVLNGGSGAKGNTKTARDGTTTTSLDCYIDGFRIYNPMNNNGEDYIESEQAATYYNVIDSLNSNYISSDTTVDGIAYVETALTEGTLSFANYESTGPQNELYLNGGSSSALVLKVQLPTTTSRVHLGLRAVTGTATVKVGTKDFVINGATEMYYDVTDCVTVDDTGVATITIQNTGTGVLAVNYIKLTGDAAMNLVTADDMNSAYELMTATAERAEVINGVVTPVAEEAETTTDSSELSFIEQIIAKIMEILESIFKFLPVGEVA